MRASKREMRAQKHDKPSRAEYAIAKGKAARNNGEPETSCTLQAPMQALWRVGWHVADKALKASSKA